MQPTEDDFESYHPLSVGKTRNRAVISSRVLKAGIVVVAATALGIAVQSAGGVAARLSDVTASLVDNSATWFATVRSTPTIQSSAVARLGIAIVAGPAAQSQAENSETISEALLGQFRAWAAEKDVQAPAEVAQPIQEAPAEVMINAPAQVKETAQASLRPAEKHRHVRSFPNSRAEMRPVHNPRKKVQRDRNARLQDPPAQDARAKEQAGDVQAPSLLQTFGWRN